MTDYSTFTDKQIDAEIAKRLGIIDDWTKDANAALGLIPPTLELSIMGQDVELIDHEADKVAIAKGVVARAVCECWLMWQDDKLSTP